MTIEEMNKKISKLKIILIEKKIITNEETIGIKHLVKYNNLLKYGKND